MTKTFVFTAAIALSISGTAFAGPVDNSASSLESVTRISPRDGGAYIELANAYVRAGRNEAAQIAYRRALTLDNVMLETRNGDAIWSHEVARKMLAAQVSAR